MTSERPNIVLIFSDQQHWRAWGGEDPTFETPNLDRLAEQSFVFGRSFCTTPQCSPSRSSMFTGRYPSETGVMGNIGAYGGAPLRTETVAIPLQAAGYTTGYFGKWHLGQDPVGTAGWDEAAGDIRTDRPADAETTRLGVDFLRRRAGQRPFALFLSYNDPHDVYDFDPGAPVPDRCPPLPESWHRQAFEQVPGVHEAFMTQDQGTLIHGLDADIWQGYHAFYREKVRLYDAEVGRVLDALERWGAADNTLVIVTSDHGDMDTHHRLIFKGPFMYEEMVRVPLVIRVPASLGSSSPRRVDDVDVVNTDLAPTLLDFAGSSPDRTLSDGFSLRPLLTASGPGPCRDYVIGQYHGKQRWVNPIRMIRTAEFKYNRYLAHGEELYHLSEDPHELVNLAADPGYRRIKAELSAELDGWITAHDDPFYDLKVTNRAGSPLDPAA